MVSWNTFEWLLKLTQGFRRGGGGIFDLSMHELTLQFVSNSLGYIYVKQMFIGCAMEQRKFRTSLTGQPDAKARTGHTLYWLLTFKVPDEYDLE